MTKPSDIKNLKNRDLKAYKEYILHKVDHTLLSATATEEEIIKILQEAHDNNCASACIPPSYVALAKEYFQKIGSKTKICTVIGFPLGYNTSETKLFETEDAIAKGTDEIDMVINLTAVKNKKYDEVQKEIELLNAVCHKNKVILKVIIETCYLSEEEKIQLTKIISLAGADYIKTSTGFGTAGATIEDIEIFKKYAANDKDYHLLIKAAGGMKSLADVESFCEAGADRLGTSKALRLLEEIECK